MRDKYKVAFIISLFVIVYLVRVTREHQRRIEFLQRAHAGLVKMLDEKHGK